MARPQLFVNRLFGSQRVTGQQRYASEVAHLLLSRPGVVPLDLPSALRSSSAAHLWAHTLLPLKSGAVPLLSMTARSPMFARRHTVVVHDLFPLTHPEWYTRRYIATHAPVLAAQLRNATCLAAVSQPVADQVRERYSDKIVIVAPNAPSPQFSVSASAEKYIDAGDTSSYILAVGSLDPRKNFRGLVDAYTGLPDHFRRSHPLWIVGGRASSYASAGVNVAGDRDIRTLGYVTDGQLATLYRHAAAVVVPSLDEGFGLPIVEALMSRAHVLASDIPVFRWVAGSAVSYFDPLSLTEMRRAILDAVASPKPLVSKAVDAQYIADRFSWTDTAELLFQAATRH